MICRLNTGNMITVIADGFGINNINGTILNFQQLLAGTASNREVKLLLTVSFLNDALGLEL